MLDQDKMTNFSKSKFRTSFVLSELDFCTLKNKGLAEIELEANIFIKQRLSDALPRHDGKQTPTKGHPVFTAQHATATCCRACIERWHQIPRGKSLTDLQIKYLVAIIVSWLDKQLANNKFKIKKTALQRQLNLF